MNFSDERKIYRDDPQGIFDINCVSRLTVKSSARPRNNTLLLKSDRYFGGYDCASNIEEHDAIVQCLERTRFRSGKSFPRTKGGSDNLYRAFASATPLGRS